MHGDTYTRDTKDPVDWRQLLQDIKDEDIAIGIPHYQPDNEPYATRLNPDYYRTGGVI